MYTSCQLRFEDDVLDGRERIRYDPVPVAARANDENQTRKTNKVVIVHHDHCFLIVAPITVDAAGCGARQIQQQPLPAHETDRRPIGKASVDATQCSRRTNYTTVPNNNNNSSPVRPRFFKNRKQNTTLVLGQTQRRYGDTPSPVFTEMIGYDDRIGTLFQSE